MTTRARTPRLRAAGLLVFGAFVVIAGFFLFEEHRAHVLGALPYILGIAGLLFCIFGHRHAGTWRTHDDEHVCCLGFIIIMVGFLLQWPTVLTLLMFPVLVVMYVRLAHRDEREVKTELGATWDAYAARTPRWIPRLRARLQAPQPH